MTCIIVRPWCCRNDTFWQLPQEANDRTYPKITKHINDKRSLTSFLSVLFLLLRILLANGSVVVGGMYPVLLSSPAWSTSYSSSGWMGLSGSSCSIIGPTTSGSSSSSSSSKRDDWDACTSGRNIWTLYLGSIMVGLYYGDTLLSVAWSIDQQYLNRFQSDFMIKRWWHHNR